MRLNSQLEEELEKARVDEIFLLNELRKNKKKQRKED